MHIPKGADGLRCVLFVFSTHLALFCFFTLLPACSGRLFTLTCFSFACLTGVEVGCGHSVEICSAKCGNKGATERSDVVDVAPEFTNILSYQIDKIRSVFDRHSTLARIWT